MAMNQLRVIPVLCAAGRSEEELLREALACEARGAYEIVIGADRSSPEAQERSLAVLRRVFSQLHIPAGTAVGAKRFEDIKKAFYTGASMVFIEDASSVPEEVLTEAAGRFGAEKIFLCLPSDAPGNAAVRERLERLGGHGLLLDGPCAGLPESGAPRYLHGVSPESAAECAGDYDALLVPAGEWADSRAFLHSAGIRTDAFVTGLRFDQLKAGAGGLVPCIVQDFSGGEVLMMAWMNQVAFEQTLASGRMTYYSRSRQCLWRKGETSGHFQYLKALRYDCDADTLLAQVDQVGAACHTGHRSCFFRDVMPPVSETRQDLEVLQEVYDTIADRKAHPKEGSYTNYLFDKGIDKILKKCGEENAEIIIAAKNPDKQELQYEIADYLYHLMVLMAQQGLTWQDITRELADRH